MVFRLRGAECAAKKAQTTMTIALRVALKYPACRLLKQLEIVQLKSGSKCQMQSSGGFLQFCSCACLACTHVF